MSDVKPFFFGVFFINFHQFMSSFMAKFSYKVEVTGTTCQMAHLHTWPMPLEPFPGFTHAVSLLLPNGYAVSLLLPNGQATGCNARTSVRH